MKRKARMAALLASKTRTLSEPGWTFDPDRMTRIPDCHSIIEVLRRIKHGEPEWAHRNVTLWFPGPSNAWVLVYSLRDARASCFDFMYTHKKPPQKALSELLEKYPECTVIDWSAGRLACIEAEGVDVETLAKIIQDVAETVWGEHSSVVDASYEEMSRA